MLGRTHFVFGLLIAIIFWKILLVFPSSLLLVILLGSLFPDVDTQTSILGRRFPFIGWLFKHRGFFHSFFSLALFALIVYISSNIIHAIGFALSFVSHLILDSLTKKGVSLFIFDKRISGPFISGKLFDKILFYSLCLLIVIVYRT